MPALFSSLVRIPAALDAADKARKAQIENERRAEADRRYLEDLWRGTRFGKSFDVGGRPLEDTLARDWMGIYNATGALSPTEKLGKYTSIAAGLEPVQQGAVRTVNDVFSGRRTDEALEYAQPVFAARRSSAKSIGQGITQGIMERLNAIKAGNAAKGFVGSGSAAENLALRTQVAGRQAEAQAMAQAILENALQEQAIQEEGRREQLASIGLPGYVAQQGIGLADLPSAALIRDYQARISPLSFFKLSDPPYASLPRTPQKVPIPGLTQIAWEGAASTADAVSDLVKDLLAAYLGGGFGGGGGGGGGGASNAAAASGGGGALGGYGGYGSRDAGSRLY